MNLLQGLKNYFRSAFRELIVHNHSSLEFRSKLFTLVIGARTEESDLSCEYKSTYKTALKIYDGDKSRATTLVNTTKEYLAKIHLDNDLGVDELAIDITKILKHNQRFASKIDIDQLLPLLECHDDIDTRSYQEHILDFLESVKAEYTV